VVHVNNLVESGERQSFTRPDAPSQDLSGHVQQMMRDMPHSKSSGRSAEPPSIDLSPTIYGSNCDGTAKAHKQLTPAERNFTPDMTYGGANGREFQQKMNEQRAKPIELNGDGKYEVKPGDTLSTLAERSLKIDGHKPSQAEIQKRTKELEELNGDQLGNRHLLKPGMKLKLAPGQEDLECKQNGPAYGSYPAEGGQDSGKQNGAGAGSADRSDSRMNYIVNSSIAF